MLSLIVQKLKSFRLTGLAAVLLALASYRTVTSGQSIALVGVCAAIVPFFSQFRNFPKAEGTVGPVPDVISSYLANLVLMLIYLAWVLLLTWVGRTFVPSYIPNPHFRDMLFVALGADVVFISAVIPVCRELKPMQRMISGLVLTNALLVFMQMAAALLKTGAIANIPLLSCGFCGLIMALTFGMIFAGSREEA